VPAENIVFFLGRHEKNEDFTIVVRLSGVLWGRTGQDSMSFSLERDWSCQRLGNCANFSSQSTNWQSRVQRESIYWYLCANSCKLDCKEYSKSKYWDCVFFPGRIISQEKKGHFAINGTEKIISASYSVLTNPFQCKIAWLANSHPDVSSPESDFLTPANPGEDVKQGFVGRVEFGSDVFIGKKWFNIGDCGKF